MSKPGFTRAEPDARRLSLIAATARVLARDGASGASVRAIAVEAGVSPGLVAHHFGGVDALIAATYAHVGEQVAATLDAAVCAAGNDPQARLIAYVTASFAPSVADRDLLATWTAFWGLVIARGEIAALHDAQYARYRAELERLLAACGLPSTARRRAAISIAALVDGLWLELCLSPAVLDADEARAIAQSHIAALFQSNPAPPN